MKQILLQVFGIAVLAALLGLGTYAFRARGIPRGKSRESQRLAQEQFEPLFTISLPRAVEVFSKGTALFVDGRDADLYRHGHIPGALNLPVADFDRLFPGLEKSLRSAPLVVAYCDSPGCEGSEELAEKLLLAGLPRVAVFKGGILQWQAAGQPLAENWEQGRGSRQ